MSSEMTWTKYRNAAERCFPLQKTVFMKGVGAQSKVDS